MASGRPAFRPDIEGLRGVAILLVVLFHAGASAFAGGFVGVDVFFVLSGFFITGLLMREAEDTGTVDVNAFWGKRALRLLPTLLVVLGVTLVLVMWLYAPIDRPEVASNARAVAMYSGNVAFASNGQNYFSGQDNPLLHTWSLAVEEQFYLVWPLLFLLGAQVVIRRSARAAAEEQGSFGRRGLLIGTLIVGAISFVASVWLTSTAQPWAFFGMPTRIWEFALGGAVALTLDDTSDRIDAAAGILQWIGVALIGIAAWTYDDATPYPGVAAGLPALGAAALLVGGRRAPDSFITRTLGAPTLQFFGKLSYGWYLWHWPLVGLGAVLYPQIGVAGKLAWSVLALVLAWFTYWFIEQPARTDGRLTRIPREWIGLAALGASVGAAAIAHASLGIAKRRIEMADQKVFARAREDHAFSGCWTNTLDEFRGPCVIGDQNSKTVIALLGDSHAQHWTSGLDEAGKQHGWRIEVMVKGGCPVADMPEVLNGRLKNWYAECARFREAMVQRIIATKPAAVILSNWDHYLALEGGYSKWQVTSAVWQAGLRRTYTRLTNAGITTIAFRGTPRTWFDVPGCLSRRAANLPFAQSCTYNRAASFSPAAINAQTAAARGLPVKFVDMNDQICATSTCSPMKQGIVVFTDDNHLTAKFSRLLGEDLGMRVVAVLR